MAIQTPQSSNLIQREILDSLALTGVRQTTPGGKARAWSDAVASMTGASELRVFNMIAQSFLPNALADNLDFLGSIYGVTRISQQSASADLVDANFKFYVANGTFGDINGGNDIIIPVGTRIITGRLSDPAYTVNYATTLSAGTGQQSISVTCSASGAAGNNTANTYVKHNFTNYKNSMFGSLLVTNDYGIVVGREQEDDDSYRFRINLKLQNTGGSAEPDLRFALLQVPGIQDVVFETLAGTYNVYVYGISPTVPVSLLRLVQSVLDDKTAFPLTGISIAPDLIGISLSTTISTIKGLALTDQNAAMNAAASAAQDYINNLSVGQALIINDISDQMMNASSKILDIGDPNRPLQEVFIWRSRLNGVRYSRFLIDNYTPAIGERIVVEQSVSNPINLVTK